jgi:hypothetical protein
MRCYFCKGQVEVEREASSNACLRCSIAQHTPTDLIAAFDAVPAELRPMRDFILFGEMPPAGIHVDREVMEAARQAKWCAEEGTVEKHMAAYWYARLYQHNRSLVES